MTVGDNIKSCRKKAGLTQRELAEKCGYATGTIQQYELGQREPRMKQLEQIARVLNTSVYEIINGFRGKMDEDIRRTNMVDSYEVVKESKLGLDLLGKIITHKNAGEGIVVGYSSVTGEPFAYFYSGEFHNSICCFSHASIIGVVGNKEKDDSKTEDILAILRWRLSPNGTARSGLRFDRESKEILINEEALMQAIQLANPGQSHRKIRLISEEEFRNRKKFVSFSLSPRLEEN